MDWDDLRIFLAVARAESLSAAGRKLKIDPATVGRRIARLEEAVAARLFVKGPQGYALTDAGGRLLAHAERAETVMEGAAEALTGAEGLSGQIRIGAPDGCANYLLAASAGADLRRQSGPGGADRRPAASLQPVQARGRHGDCGQPPRGRAPDGAKAVGLPAASCGIAATIWPGIPRSLARRI